MSLGCLYLTIVNQRSFSFLQNLEMNLASIVTLETEAQIKYICTIFCAEALRQFGLLSSDVKNTETPLDADYLLKCLAWYFSF